MAAAREAETEAGPTLGFQGVGPVMDAGWTTYGWRGVEIGVEVCFREGR